MTVTASCLLIVSCCECSLLTVGWGGEELMCAGLRNARPTLEFCFYLLRFSVCKSFSTFRLLDQVAGWFHRVINVSVRPIFLARRACHSQGWIVPFRSCRSVLKTALDSLERATDRR